MSCQREDKNNKFLEANKINTRLSIDYNGEAYLQETVMDLIYLPYWKKLSIEDRLQCIVWIFENLLKELELDNYLDHILFIPKAGYEDAFASYDKEDKVIFLNPNYIESTSLLCLWNLFHEFQHVVQHRDEDLLKEEKLLKNDFYNNISYYFMYDGTSYRSSSEEDFTYKIKKTEEFCLELYLRNPIEIDANNYAYLSLKKVIERNLIRYGKDNETTEGLNKIKKMLLPEFNIIRDGIAIDIIKYCKTLVELSYQFSKGNIGENEYNRKNIELYNAVKMLVDDKKSVTLSFNPNNLLCKNHYI